MEISFQEFSRLKSLCRNLIQNPRSIENIKELNIIITKSPESFVKVVQPTVLSTFYPIIKSISENKSSYSSLEKQLIVDTLGNILNKSSIDKLGLFFNIYAFLLFEIYDHIQHKVLPISEEYKLSIMQCVKVLANGVSSELLFELYTKKNAPRLCQMLYVAIEIAKNEQLKSLRISAIECIMSLARVLEYDDLQDKIIRNQVAEVFLFFLPGVASGLRQVALENEKIGHKVPKVALKAWGRIITLMMEDYNTSNKLDFLKFRNNLDTSSRVENQGKWKNKEEIDEYLHNTKRTVQWYSNTDSSLQNLIVDFVKLSHHSHPLIRLELTDMCELIIENCLTTMPSSICNLIHIVIILTEDEVEEIRLKNAEIMKRLSNQISLDNLKALLENLQEGLYSGINSLPRKFNGIDDREQLASLNLIIGYLKLFGKHKLNLVLISGNCLEKLMQTLIFISKLEKSNIGLLEEYSVKDLEATSCLKKPWKNFCHFKEDSIRTQLEKLCALLGGNDSFRIVSDYLLDTILYEPQHRKEAIFILNEVLSGCQYNNENDVIITNILNTYIEETYWQVPVEAGVDQFSYEHTLLEVQHNVIQICLLVEGIGKISLIFHNNFQKFLLKVLYKVLEKAGHNHLLVRSSGLIALENITKSCGYQNVTMLLNENIDYFSFHLEKKLNRAQNKEEVLNVLSVVLKYSTADVVQYISDIITEVLVQSCDKFKAKYATVFLQVFKTFVLCLRKWFNVEKKIEPIKSKKQTLNEIEDFKVSGIEEIESFNDEIMGKTAEELFKEDMEKKEDQLNNDNEPEVDEYKKPEPPLHIKLTVAILTRSLHFLPSKDLVRKLLTLEILSNGLEVIREWENELLPIVHQIWSPLVQRFKEYHNPLIINYSFQLLVTLSRLSKTFIRMRTVKDVLPSILEVLDKMSKESYLKDKGSAYRYSQFFKLQIIILENLGPVLIDLDIQEEHIDKVSEIIFIYLSEKQPIQLQNLAMELFKVLAIYDPVPIKKKVNVWERENNHTEYEKNVHQLCTILSQINE